MTWLRRIREFFAGNRRDPGAPDMARIWEMLEYLRDEAYVPPSDAPAG